jgi:catechol 2,3-dioxygenase-like lactoylglutathione lyase family enzyme
MKEIRHTGIVVSDMERSLKFYRDLLGLKVSVDFCEKGNYIDNVVGLQDTELRMVKLTTDDGSMIELMQFLSHPVESPLKNKIYDLGCSHVAFTVDDLDKEYQKLMDNGISFNCSPIISPDGYAKVTYCHDPDGISIELVEVL